MTSVFETFMEQTIGASITLCTEAFEVVICNTCAPICMPICDILTAALIGGK